jgi:large repetitive protein
MRRVALVLVIAALGSAVGATSSAFSAAAHNPANVFTAAADFCVAPGPQTVTADADAFVRQTSASSNFGTATTLRVQSGSTVIVLGPDNERSLVHFALPSVPAHCALTGATLRLNASSASAGRVLQAYRASSAWTQAAVTWNNQPAVTGLAATTTSGTGWREWSVTAQTEAMYAGTNTGFIIRDAAESALLTAAQVFSSREGANPPQLVLTFG